jgi:excisionase family DNA binding protein
MATMQQTVYTIEEVAKILRVSEATIRRLVRNGELEGFYVGSQLRVTADALDRYMQRKPQS